MTISEAYKLAEPYFKKWEGDSIYRCRFMVKTDMPDLGHAMLDNVTELVWKNRIRHAVYHSTDNGNCRINYKRGRQLYVLQLYDNRGDVPEFKFYSCTDDGEPSHECDLSYFRIDLPMGNQNIDCEAREFLYKFMGSK